MPDLNLAGTQRTAVAIVLAVGLAACSDDSTKLDALETERVALAEELAAKTETISVLEREIVNLSRQLESVSDQQQTFASEIRDRLAAMESDNARAIGLDLEVEAQMAELIRQEKRAGKVLADAIRSNEKWSHTLQMYDPWWGMIPPEELVESLMNAILKIEEENSSLREEIKNLPSENAASGSP